MAQTPACLETDPCLLRSQTQTPPPASQDSGSGNGSGSGGNCVPSVNNAGPAVKDDELSDAEVSGSESDSIDTSRIVSYSNFISHELRGFFNKSPLQCVNRNGARTASDEDNVLQIKSTHTYSAQEEDDAGSGDLSFPISTAASFLTPHLRSIVDRKCADSSLPNQLNRSSSTHNAGK
ncbi:hypothetical protein LPJ72_001593, partial [Coemansia sp. Benny D160-2]